MTRPPARTAVLIGNGVFPQAEGMLTPLAAPAHDVSVLGGLLADPEVCRFDAPTTLVDRDAQTIKKTLLRTLNTARPQDLVLVYYAGHGKLDGSQLYLCTHDTEPETLAATAVSIADIRDYVSRSPCKQVVLILDCCFSGAAADEFRTRGELSDRIEAAASARGLYLLTSCANYETSLEHVGTGEHDIPYGVYTRTLADGILSGEADLYGDGRITPLELARFLQSRIPGQTPRVSLIDTEGEEPVLAWTTWAQNDGERKRVRTRLTRWFAEETIPDETFYQAMALLGRVPQNLLEKRRKRLMGMCTAAGFEDVFTRGWLALEAGEDDPAVGLERFLTEHAADGSLAEGLYVEAMRLLALPPEGELQQRRKRLLTRLARSPERDIGVLVEAWQALDRRAQPRMDETVLAVTRPPVVEGPADGDAAAAPVDDTAATSGVVPSTQTAEPASIPPEALPERPPAAAAETGPLAPGAAPMVAPASETEEARELAEDADPSIPGTLDDARADTEDRSGEAGAGTSRPGRELAPWELDHLRELKTSHGRVEADPAGESGAGPAYVAVHPEPEPLSSTVQRVHGDGARSGAGRTTVPRPMSDRNWGLLMGAIVIAAMIGVFGLVVVLSRDEGDYGDDYVVTTTADTTVVPGADTTMAAVAVPTQDTLMALPLPTSQHRPRAGTGDFPEISAKLDGVRFYEGGDRSQPTASDYGYRFMGPGTRFVWYDLMLTYPGGDTTLATGTRVEAVWYNLDRTELARDTVVIAAGSRNLRFGRGSNTPGSWPAGVYYLEILDQRERIALAAFEIRGDSGGVYDLPDVSGRATDLRFYDDQRAANGTFTPQWRFSQSTISLSSWLQFEHPPAASARDYPIEVVYFTSGGNPVEHVRGTVRVAAGSTASSVAFHTIPKTWERGTYRAEYFVNGTRVATGAFDVY